MSGFFSLTGKDDQEQQRQDQQVAETNYNLFLLNKNEEIYSKGFEQWQQYYQLHHHRSVDFSVGQSSGGRRRSTIGSGGIGGGGDEPAGTNYSSYNRSAELGFRVMNINQGRGGNEGINCQDCGNQAKKDCEHMRCRTCCKSRGYPCQTHVKSTWVPAARRRERQQQQQQQMTSLQQDQQQQQLTVRGENAKRLREGDGRVGAGGSGGGGGGGLELGHFPAEVSSPAIFRCVRVSAMDDAEEHLAYQTAVNIGGHVFKGILYDQGPDSRYGGAAGEGPSSGGGGGGSSHQHQPLGLIAASAAAAAATVSNTSLTMFDPSNIYPNTHQLSGFMAGTQFFLPPRP